MFGRATITLGIGPHSNISLFCYNRLSFVLIDSVNNNVAFVRMATAC